MISGHWENKITDKFVRSRFQNKVQRFNDLGISPPRVVVEQGTGWHGVDVILFYLCGANSILTYDTMPWLNKMLFERVLKHALDLREIVLEWRGVNRDVLDQRIVKLEKLAEFQFPRILESLGIKYRVRKDMKRSDIMSNSVDLFYSDSTMQRIYPDDINVLLHEAYRFLKKNKTSYHVIDCKDFHAITDESVPELGYLTYSEHFWKLLTSKYINYQNRLRLPHFVEIFQSAGFEVEITDRLISEGNLTFVLKHLSNCRPSENTSPIEIAVSKFEMIAHKVHCFSE